MKSLTLARVWVLRGGRAAFALLLLLRRTPGMGRVAETELYLCLVSPLVRRRGNWRRYWGSLESTSGWSCVCSSFAFKFCVLLSRLVVIIGPDSKYAFFVYSSEHRAEEVLRVHHRIPITVRGRSLRIERTENRPYSLSSASMGSPLEIGKPLDAATSNAIVEELRRTVPKWRGSNEPSRVIWIGRLPTNITRKALTNFWSRLGCVVEVRTSTLIAAQCLSSTYS